MNSLLAIATEGRQRTDSRTAEKILSCLSYRPLLMVHPSWGPWCLETYHQPCCLLLWRRPKGCFKDKKHRRRNTSILPSSSDQTWLQPACPTLSLSVTNVPAVNVDQPFLIFVSWTQAIKYTQCPWCNGYRRRKWTRRREFKSWTRLIAFHIALIPLGKVWIQLFSLQLWVNSRTDWALQPWWGN